MRVIGIIDTGLTRKICEDVEFGDTICLRCEEEMKSKEVSKND
jgi:hypothetical protein